MRRSTIFLSLGIICSPLMPQSAAAIPANPPYGHSYPRSVPPSSRGNYVPRLNRTVRINGKLYYEVIFNGRRVYQPIDGTRTIYTDEPDSHDRGTWTEDVWATNIADARRRCNRMAANWSARGNVVVHHVRCNTKPSRNGDVKCTCTFRG